MSREAKFGVCAVVLAIGASFVLAWLTPLIPKNHGVNWFVLAFGLFLILLSSGWIVVLVRRPELPSASHANSTGPSSPAAKPPTRGIVLRDSEAYLPRAQVSGMDEGIVAERSKLNAPGVKITGPDGDVIRATDQASEQSIDTSGFFDDIVIHSCERGVVIEGGGLPPARNWSIWNVGTAIEADGAKLQIENLHIRNDPAPDDDRTTGEAQPLEG